MGAAGARRIVTSIVESLSRAIDRGYSFADAVAAPRLHPDDDTLVVERRLPAYTWPDSLVAVFEDRGWPVRNEGSGPYFGRIHGVQIINGERFGVADPRWDGTARSSGGND
jgi:gamma-glutamyltranspeptidase/glutathione hydrolase